MAVLVALAESTVIAVVWTGVAGPGGHASGPRIAGHLGVETVIAAGAIAGGTLTGARIRQRIEGFLDARRRLMRDVARVPIDDDPFVMAELLLRPARPLDAAHENPSIIWFRADGRSIILAIARQRPAAGASRQAGSCPRRAARSSGRTPSDGPWINGWTVRSDDGGLLAGHRGRSESSAVAYVPLVFEGRVIGVVGAGPERPGGRSVGDGRVRPDPRAVRGRRCARRSVRSLAQAGGRSTAAGQSTTSWRAIGTGPSSSRFGG